MNPMNIEAKESAERKREIKERGRYSEREREKEKNKEIYYIYKEIYELQNTNKKDI